MKRFEYEDWDSGRLRVNRQFVSVLRANGLTSFQSLMEFQGGSIAKNVRPDRVTTRFVLTDQCGREQAFYIKRHDPPSWKEYVKPLLRLTWPIIGARNEWNAIIRFHQAGIRTMTPVAFGQHAAHSFVVTQAIEGCRKLSDWAGEHLSAPPRSFNRQTRELIDSVADVTRWMHNVGLHHQDFYLCHLLVPETNGRRDVIVIDLGRARFQRRLSRRWIVKDLAQLNYSAPRCSRSERCRFLRSYLGRRFRVKDRRLIRKILRKSQRIARHSEKNRL